jgi:hypothetical protein
VALQDGVQTPAVQEVAPWGFVQSLEQEPQWLILVSRLTSQPLSTLPSQSPKWLLHAILHCPLAQVAVPLAVEHVWVQLPQCRGLVCRLVSQPLDGLVLQSANGVTQENWHTPCTHAVGVPLGPEHAALHAPQCKMEWLVSVSQPLGASPSQSA